jgi:hypothetical protein
MCESRLEKLKHYNASEIVEGYLGVSEGWYASATTSALTNENIVQVITEKYNAGQLFSCIFYTSAITFEEENKIYPNLVNNNVYQVIVSEETDEPVVPGETTTVTTVIDDKEDIVTMPTITVPEGKLFKGFSLTEGGEIVLEVAADAELKWADLKDLANGATSIDLYPVFADKPVVLEDLVVYVQTGSNLSVAEAALLQERFETTLTDEVVKFNLIEGNAATFTAGIGDDADVIIGGNNPVNNFNKHAEGETANAGAKHFANTSRKVIISAGTQHLELAKTFYEFVKADAPTYEIHSTFWTKGGDWVTADEVTKITADMNAAFDTYFAIGEGETLLDKYNVTVTYYEATNTKVADLGAETLALRDGKGTDLIIGCGKNVTSSGGVEVVAKKVVDASQIAADRYVALVNDNPITRNIYDNYFIEAPAAEA